MNDNPAKPRRWRRRLGIALLVLLLAWAGVRFWPAPADRGLTRPESVRATSFAQRDVTVDGFRLRLIDEGPREAPPLLLLPGHTSRIEELDHLVPLLSDSFRVVIFDFPGSGYSDRPDRPYSIAMYEDVVVGVMDALGIERAHIAGGSQGANVCFGVAARYPERVLRLVPWAPGSAWPASPWIADAGWLIAGYLPFQWMASYQSTFWYAEDDPQGPALLAETFRYYEEVGGPGFTRMYWDIALDTVRRSLYDVAPEVDRPTLLCWAEHDKTPYMASGIARIGELLPHGEVVLFEDSPHAIANTFPEQLVARLREFLTREESGLP